MLVKQGAIFEESVAVTMLMLFVEAQLAREDTVVIFPQLVPVDSKAG